MNTQTITMGFDTEVTIPWNISEISYMKQYARERGHTCVDIQDLVLFVDARDEVAAVLEAMDTSTLKFRFNFLNNEIRHWVIRVLKSQED